MKLMGQAFLVWLVLTLITGAVYPLFMLGIAKSFFGQESSGSLLKDTSHNQIVGSSLIAQDFKAPIYFWPRPSAGNYNAYPAKASNLGPTSAELKKEIDERGQYWADHHGAFGKKVPEDLLMASGSGLDPHISVAAAHFQLKRVAKARNLDEKATIRLALLLEQIKEDRQWGLWGEPRINVLRLNRALDENFGKLKE